MSTSLSERPVVEVKPVDVLGELNAVEAKHAPKCLFAQGELSLLNEGLRVSVVGSRKPSEAGVRRARVFCKALVGHEITIVSGLADGIDTIAHETAISNGGKTIAVLGTPLDKCYPAKNRPLLDKIKRDHLVISQFPEGYPSQPRNFPMRNRTMALVSDATVIIEAGEKSGTRHQGWEALRLGRLVFIMESVANNLELSWPKEMIGYGAQVLSRDDVPYLVENLPQFTSDEALAF